MALPDQGTELRGRSTPGLCRVRGLAPTRLESRAPIPPHRDGSAPACEALGASRDLSAGRLSQRFNTMRSTTRSQIPSNLRSEGLWRRAAAVSTMSAARKESIRRPSRELYCSAMPDLHAAVGTAIDWPVEHAAAAVITADGAVATTAGEWDRPFALASVTKLLAAYAVLVAVETGKVDWSTPAGPSGATVRHLAAHSSGLSFAEAKVLAKPGTRRIYSNLGFDILGEVVASGVGRPFAEHLEEAVLAPLGMRATRLDGSPAASGVSTAADLARFAAELQRPTLVRPETLAAAVNVAFPGLNGVLPGFGMQKPNDWGLGFEIRDGKSPHWTGQSSSPRTFGDFGQTGTFLWVDPDREAACVALTDRAFGPWAIRAWPLFTDTILAAL